MTPQIFENWNLCNFSIMYLYNRYMRCTKEADLTPNDTMVNNKFYTTIKPQVEGSSESEFEFVIKSLDAIIWEYDLEKNRLSSDSPGSALFEGKNFEEYIAIHHPDDGAILRKTFEELIGGSINRMRLDVRLRQSDNSYLWIRIHGAVFKRTEKGIVRQIIGLRRDITNEHDMMEELVVLRNKAEEANRLKTTFFANMSHEIRTPLNAILGFSNLIVESSGDESLAEYAKMITANNELLAQLINDVLDLSRIEAGKLDFNMSEICLDELLEQCRQMFQIRAQRGVKIVFDAPFARCRIISEQTRLTQVISNFLGNAIKYTLRGSIHFGYELRQSGLYFYVTDTGKGIAEENIPLVFDRFTKFDHSVQGTGLGLSICKMIVDRLEGEIGVESKLGRGSKFWFTLPCKVTTY